MDELSVGWNILLCFFFSSRRRHTRWTGDWSSDVCSSDLSAALTGRALRALNSAVIPTPAGLAQRAQFRVHLRMQERQENRIQRGFLWIACAASWLFGAVSAPYVWSGLQWFGQSLALPHLVPEIGFGLWWALPAIVAGAIVLAENARYSRQRDWSN